ncbi:MAG TPA: squalene/phytoene synthase family protein [Gammaproteobacteria bacterium]|nr:squalene/phytoene synthase family protein [Gammaproteobacteria bacterium]
MSAAEMTPQQQLLEQAVPRGSSLYYSVYFAPRESQPALRALYAYQREITEILREVRDRSVAAAKLKWWREELDRAFDGRPQHPVAQALATEVLPGRTLSKEQFAQVIEGVELDLDYGLYPSFRELSNYCHQVGGSITELAVQICGFRNPATLRYAHDLGMALQLATLLRNVRRDLDAGRLYIPEADMRQAGVSQADLLAHKTTPPIRQLFEMQVARIEDFFAHAFAHLPAEDRCRQRSGLILAHLYQAQLAEMQDAGFPLLERRIHLTPLRKFWIAWRVARRPANRKQSP